MKQYLDHARAILSDERSEFKHNKRTGMGTISLFGYQNFYDLREGFPLMTTKRIPFKTLAHELIWFMRGEHNIKYLVDNGAHIWDDNAFQFQLKKQGRDKDVPMYSEQWVKEKQHYIARIKEDADFAMSHGDLGPVYGTQWRNWQTTDEFGNIVKIDQLENLVEQIKSNPTARRLIVSAWNPAEVPNMALPPCHTLFHVNINEGNLDLQLYQRSADEFLGVPFNISSYAILAQILAQQADLTPRRFVHTFGDSHFYAGAGARAQFYKDNFRELSKWVKNASCSEDYQVILDWINRSAPSEEAGKEGQDHITGILEQLQRTPKKLPKLEIAKKRFDELTIDDFKLIDYNPDSSIKRAMAV